MTHLGRRALLVFVAGFCAVVLIAGSLWLADVTAGDLRREMRVALGLPKNWKTHFHDDQTTHAALACPDPSSHPIVIITGGQSNAANSLGPEIDVIGNRRNAQVFDGRCFALESPVLGATNYGMAVWPRLGDLLERATGRPVVFINGAVGGAQIGDFIDLRSGYLDRLATTIGEAHALGLTPDAAIWIQGTTDAGVGMDPRRYLADQRKLIAAIEGSVPGGAPLDWIIPLNTRCDNRDGNGVEIEQVLAAYTDRAGDRVHTGPRLNGYGPELRRDSCHLNSRGRDRLAEELAARLLPILDQRDDRKDGATGSLTPRA